MGKPLLHDNGHEELDSGLELSGYGKVKVPRNISALKPDFKDHKIPHTITNLKSSIR